MARTAIIALALSLASCTTSAERDRDYAATMQQGCIAQGHAPGSADYVGCMRGNKTATAGDRSWEALVSALMGGAFPRP